eukprot:6163472-Pleurochrysis_carterae.AAC.1
MSSLESQRPHEATPPLRPSELSASFFSLGAGAFVGGSSPVLPSRAFAQVSEEGTKHDALLLDDEADDALGTMPATERVEE